ncbi:MAG: N-acetylglucosamine-6-phosphate deacetylase [Leptolyngbyaceae bacterium]|nr:N-acetylglucosamine-6-phosphate deacetylase [Leptolyngbyaceae bacterium]
MQILNARLPGYPGLQQVVVDQQSVLQEIYPMADAVWSTAHGPILDIQEEWLSPSGVDLQINGGLGLAFPDLVCDQPETLEQLWAVRQLLWDQGIDGFLPTIVTSAIAQTQRALGAIATAMAQRPTRPAAQILGVHLEGPCLNPAKRGAHPEEHLLSLTVDHIKQVLGDYATLVKVITLAPELDPTGEVIPYLRSLGITVSLGHSLATATEATRAFDQGASMITHAFNAMPGLHHRDPGLLGAALTHEAVWSGFIADGEHVCPTMLALLLRTSPNLFLVSDALAPLGLADGLYPWDTRQINVTKGTARLLDGTLSGTTLPLLAGVQNLVRWGLCEEEKAIALATTNPRQAIGLPSFAVGEPIHLLRWTPDPVTQTLAWKRL